MSGEALRLDPAKIRVPERLRPVDQDEVVKIAHSFRERGQITPIEVREEGPGQWVLVAGAHRLAAAIEIEMPEIQAVVFAGSADEARLREIDENLYRHELSPYDQAEFLAERRAIFERVYGKIRRGGDRRSVTKPKGRVRTFPAGGRFLKETAERFGLSVEVVRKALMRRRRIVPDVWRSLRGSAIGKSGRELDLLGKQPDALQAEIAREAFERKSSVKNAVARRRRVATSAELASRVAKAFGRLDAAGKQEFFQLIEAWKLTKGSEQ